MVRPPNFLLIAAAFATGGGLTLCADTSAAVGPAVPAVPALPAAAMAQRGHESHGADESGAGKQCATFHHSHALSKDWRSTSHTARRAG